VPAGRAPPEEAPLVKLAQIQDFMAQQAVRDRQTRSVRVEGASLEDALESGAVQLHVALDRLEYEVLRRGDRGLFGVGRRAWVVNVYESTLTAAASPEAGAAEGGLASGAVADEGAARPGEIFVKLIQGNVFLKVTRPHGKAPRITEQVAAQTLARRGVREFDAGMVARVVRRADGQFVQVGSFDYNPANDAVVSIELTDQEMKAYVEVRPPGPGGADLTFDAMVAVLNNNGVVHGIREDALRELEDDPRYSIAILAAEGTPPENGADAQIVYNFATERSVVLKEKNGRVDFRELNLVENVVAGQIVARKTPAGEGREGRTVTGRTLPVKAGRDVALNVGKNVKLAEDGMAAIAEINGQVLLVAGKVNVEPVYTVSGDVNLHTGNILFLGGVIVKGGVEDGFTVKAAGNIEVFGNVGKAQLDAEGDIIVHQGILGKGGGKATAGKSVYAKFIEHAHVEAGENVVASEGLIHSFVDANRKIVCQGKRASIVGGRLRAVEEINAKNLGSVAGTETLLEVGYDPKSKERLVELETTMARQRKELEELERNIKTLLTLKRVTKKLPAEKEAYLAQQMEKRSQALSAIKEETSGIEEIKARLASIKREGKISASDTVFANVKIFIKDASLVIRNEHRSVTFVLDQGNIRVTKYEPLEEDFTRKG
jgi:uncharacterized protein (DUF342 family)